MADAWDARAEKDAFFFIASGASASEEEFRRSGERELEDLILDGLELSPEASVVEIGCGVGRLLFPLADHAREVHGFDISPLMVEKGRVFCSAKPNVRLSVTDGTLAGVADGSVDLVFSYIVFQHIPEVAPIETYLREAARVLRPGGVFRFQVDGRWNPDRTDADTYDGVKLRREDVVRLVSAASLAILEEWGEETHYYWVTARKGQGDAAAVKAEPRAVDVEPTTALLVRCGVAEPRGRARAVAEHRVSFRAAVAGALRRLPSDPREFVERSYGLLLGRPPSESELAFHLKELENSWAERDAVVDSILSAKELRDVYQPRASEPSWDKAENVARVLGLPDSSGRDLFALASRVGEDLSEHLDEAAVARAFRVVLGRPPDASALAHHRRHVSRPSGRYLLAKELLSAHEDPPLVPPLPADARRALFDRFAESEPAGAELRAGESFGGESALARRLLDSTAALDDAGFVERAFRLVLGRAPDPGGAAYYLGLLAAGECSRASFLRRLFWSPELRGA
jgi:SAM-dependent methyltransferase